MSGDEVARLFRGLTGIVLVDLVVMLVILALGGPWWVLWLQLPVAFASLALAKLAAGTLEAGRSNWERGRKEETIRGDNVRSRAEARIANWLHTRGYDYQYEPELCGCRPDFYLPQFRVIIEYWGLTNPTYEDRRRKKIATYRAEGFGVISCEGWDGLEETLARKLYAFDTNVFDRPLAKPLHADR